PSSRRTALIRACSVALSSDLYGRNSNVAPARALSSTTDMETLAIARAASTWKDPRTAARSRKIISDRARQYRQARGRFGGLQKVCGPRGPINESDSERSRWTCAQSCEEDTRGHR